MTRRINLKIRDKIVEDYLTNMNNSYSSISERFNISIFKVESIIDRIVFKNFMPSWTEDKKPFEAGKEYWLVKYKRIIVSNKLNDFELFTPNKLIINSKSKFNTWGVKVFSSEENALIFCKSKR